MCPFQKCKPCVTLMIKYCSTHKQALVSGLLLPVALLHVVIILCSDKDFNYES